VQLPLNNRMVSNAAASSQDAHRKTPGQQLLHALQDSMPGRISRSQATSAAVQSRANCSITRAKHPSGNEVLGDAPAATVHQLLDATTIKARQQGSMSGVAAMLERRAARHQAAVQAYEAAKAQAQAHHDNAAAAAAACAKGRLAAISAGIESRMAALAEERVMVLDEQQVAQVWAAVEAQQPAIAAAIDGLGAELRAAAAAYQDSVRHHLQSLVAAMADIAHLDEGRQQRLTEQEAAALNQQLLENRCVGTCGGSSTCMPQPSGRLRVRSRGHALAPNVTAWCAPRPNPQVRGG
jgi:hypothetical protein